MGGQESKLDRPNANVINNVKIVEVEASTKIYLIIIIAIMFLQLATHLYQLHKKSIKKSYALSSSLAKHLEKV